MKERFHFRKITKGVPATLEQDSQLRFTGNSLTIGRAVVATLGNPERVEVEVDTQNLAIKLSTGTVATGFSIVSHVPRRRGAQLASKELNSSGMPTGWYLAVGGGVFVHESVNR